MLYNLKENVMKKSSIAIFLSFVLLTAGFVNGALQVQQNEFSRKSTLCIGTPDQNGSLGTLMSIAHKNGYLEDGLEKLGLNLRIQGFTGAGPAVNEALTANSLDMAVYADTPGIISRGKGVPTSLVAIDDAQINADICVLKAENYTSITDLKGKTIGLPKGTYMQRYFELLIRANGMQVSDFEILNMGSDGESALLSGSIDAIVWTDTAVQRLLEKNQDIRLLDTSKTHPEWSGSSVVVARDSVLKQYPELTEIIRTAMQQATEFIKQNPTQASEILAEKAYVSIDGANQIFEFDEPEKVKQRYGVLVNEESLVKLNSTEDFLLDIKYITDDFSIEEWIA